MKKTLIMTSIKVAGKIFFPAGLPVCLQKSLVHHLLAGIACLFLFADPFLQAQNNRPLLITEAVDESKLVTLAGNTRPEAKAAYDRGRVSDNLLLDHVQLLLKRSPDQERELVKFIDELHDSSSPNFHHWLTAREFGERFGVAKQDRDTIKIWLRSHSFKVNVDYTNGLLIDFSGTAGHLQEAFHTEIHRLNVKGARHIANMSDPRIPAALAPAVMGVVSLHDFQPHSMLTPRAEYTVSEGGTEDYLVVPGDLATIYNLNPLFSAGISGEGQTIVVLEDTDVFSTADWTSFRSVFGLSSFTDGSFTQIHPAPPGGSNNCSDPGAINSDIEAIVDAEYASAAAPSAAIVLASCANTATFGALVALENLLNENSTPPALVSMSYGECEAANGASSNAAFNSAFQQAVAEGVSVFVSAGDHAAAGCDVSDPDAVYGIGITGFGSSPYNVSVGGTDFGDTFAGTNSTYWKPTNSPTYESALSYIPEIPWNESCASLLLAQFEGFSQTYGSSGFCNSSKGETDFQDTTGGGGGPSRCATGTPTISGVVGGTCAGWPKPSYQSLLGNPSDGVRDIPDVSLFAASGVWLHYYPICFTGPGGTPCTEPPVNWPGAGGTSFSSPIMAGIQALVNQQAGARQGNPNYIYYSLAATQYGTSGDKTCNSTLGNAASSACIFYDVTQGDNDVDCLDEHGLGVNNCYLPSGANGVLSTSNSAYQPAFGTTTGWDFATGIGTINAYNLVNNWPSGFTLTAGPSSLTITQGSQGTSAITIIPSNGFSGSVTLSASGLPNGVTEVFSPNPATGATTLTLTANATATTGTVTFAVTGTSGSLTQTIPLSLTVTPSYTLSANPASLTIVQGNQGTSTITITPANGFTGSVTLSASGLPNGVTAAFSPNPATSTTTLTLIASATASTGTATVTITGTSGSLTAATTVTLTISPAPNYTLSANPASLTIVQGNQGTSTIAITPANGFTGSVTLSASGLPNGVTAAFSPNPATSASTLTLTTSATASTGT
ncbi:MAG: protease pro-enzyme activation domain-containing protein, partial [Terriglobales bacterium]